VELDGCFGLRLRRGSVEGMFANARWRLMFQRRLVRLCVRPLTPDDKELACVAGGASQALRRGLRGGAFVTYESTIIWFEQ
jgi:hypothetical protein